jgi:dihydroorotate dehydrogenase electron transfer subunit
MKKRIEDFTVTENRRLTDSFFVVKVSSSTPLPEILPGQFVQALVTESPSTFLRRPLSVHDVNLSENSVSLLIQIAGAGTERLSRLQPGEKLNMIYPLGNSFTLPQKGEMYC